MGPARESPVSDYLVKSCIFATDFYGYINMAVSVQAAPFVNRLLEKQSLSYSGFFHVLRLRMAKVRNDKKKSIQKTYMH